MHDWLPNEIPTGGLMLRLNASSSVEDEWSFILKE